MPLSICLSSHTLSKTDNCVSKRYSLILGCVLSVCDTPHSFIICVDHCEHTASGWNKKADINCNRGNVFTIGFRTSPE
jgi:hypothetical protein